MRNTLECLEELFSPGESFDKMIFSKPKLKIQAYRKIVISRKNGFFQIERFTDKQVFHENIMENSLKEKCKALSAEGFMQINAFANDREYAILISKKGNAVLKKPKSGRAEPVSAGAADTQISAELSKQSLISLNNSAMQGHDRQKQYILKEGELIEPLMDMGIFTKEGRIVSSMHDKYRQINRFIEIVDDEIRKRDIKSLNVIDFGCGKSYLTFILYYYLTEIRGIKACIKGLDLKADVIKKCSLAAEKYGYEGLSFELGDINGYKTDKKVDMVITLHACDTATDYALYNAVNWKADMIFSVPCCQHELNRQFKAENLDILGRYGIIRERFAALATDAIRANLLEYSGYKTQLLEFIDMEHTPKNILIRAVRRKTMSAGSMKKALLEVESLKNEFAFEPCLYKLLISSDRKSGQ